MQPPVSTIEWKKFAEEEPPCSGYYLAAWRPNSVSQLRISELWFNPSSIGPWWSTRGYLDIKCPDASPLDGMVKKVEWWGNVPDPVDIWPEEGIAQLIERRRTEQYLDAFVRAFGRRSG